MNLDYEHFQHVHSNPYLPFKASLFPYLILNSSPSSMSLLNTSSRLGVVNSHLTKALGSQLWFVKDRSRNKHPDAELYLFFNTRAVSLSKVAAVVSDGRFKPSFSSKQSILSLLSALSLP